MLKSKCSGCWYCKSSLWYCIHAVWYIASFWCSTCSNHSRLYRNKWHASNHRQNQKLLLFRMHRPKLIFFKCKYQIENKMRHSLNGLHLPLANTKQANVLRQENDNEIPFHRCECYTNTESLWHPVWWAAERRVTRLGTADFLSSHEIWSPSDALWNRCQPHSSK